MQAPRFIRSLILSSLAALCLSHVASAADWVWVEGEQPARQQVTRHPWWYDQVKRDQFSGNDFISNFSDDKDGVVDYQFNAEAAGDYEFWVRLNPVQSQLAYRLNGGAEQIIETNAGAREQTNVAADDKPDLRFLAWVKVGKVPLKTGTNSLSFRFFSNQHRHGYLDCFVFSQSAFAPKGKLKPGEKPAPPASVAAESADWFPFEPAPDTFKDSAIDLRFLNEKMAGDGGFIGARNGQFIHTKTGQPVRFWAVNGPSHDANTPEELRRVARLLAKRGVNMVRAHGAVFDEAGEPDLKKIAHLQDVVTAMKAEGIYTHLSIYFPLWLRPKAGTSWLDGYDGNKNPFAALYFNPQFQAKYRGWWDALFNTPDKQGHKLTEDPAVAGVELINEDSFFFWTFNAGNIPDAQLKILEQRFGEWAKAKYGSIAAALTAWGNQKENRDNAAEGRLGFRPLWNMFSEKTKRDQDTARFLFDVQTEFYQTHYQYLRKLGFKGLITASNWTTASAEVLGPLEKLSYAVGDFIDRHGYFGGQHKGDSSEWSIRPGHTYTERSALRFEAEELGKPRSFVHPAMDPMYNGLPSMISETTWNRPNRFRTEAPLYFAAYGALQDSDAIVHFAFDGGDWSVKPGFWMQPWTLMSPTMVGQFSATALIYRRGLVQAGEMLAKVRLNTNDLFALKGTPLPQGAALDELRLKDVPRGTEVKQGQVIDPLIHYAGQTRVDFSDKPASTTLSDLSKLINHGQKTVTSSTKELTLNYEQGVMVMNAAAAQGVNGQLSKAGKVETKDFVFESALELGCFIAVALDDKPLAQSERILVQVMSEEKPFGWKTEDAGNGVKRIVSIGENPWLVKKLQGTIRCKRADAAQLKVTALDANGYPQGNVGSASEITLKPDVVYYLISR